jgi:hypothetical protein
MIFRIILCKFRIYILSIGSDTLQFKLSYRVSYDFITTDKIIYKKHIYKNL